MVDVDTESYRHENAGASNQPRRDVCAVNDTTRLRLKVFAIVVCYLPDLVRLRDLCDSLAHSERR